MTYACQGMHFNFSCGVQPLAEVESENTIQEDEEKAVRRDHLDEIGMSNLQVSRNSPLCKKFDEVCNPQDPQGPGASGLSNDELAEVCSSCSSEVLSPSLYQLAAFVGIQAEEDEWSSDIGRVFVISFIAGCLSVCLMTLTLKCCCVSTDEPAMVRYTLMA